MLEDASLAVTLATVRGKKQHQIRRKMRMVPRMEPKMAPMMVPDEGSVEEIAGGAGGVVGAGWLVVGAGAAFEVCDAVSGPARRMVVV